MFHNGGHGFLGSPYSLPILFFCRIGVLKSFLLESLSLDNARRRPCIPLVDDLGFPSYGQRAVLLLSVLCLLFGTFFILPSSDGVELSLIASNYDTSRGCLFPRSTMNYQADTARCF